MNGFIGEFLIILGGFAASRLAGVLAATGVIIGAAYMLWLYQKIFFMNVNDTVKQLPDMNGREILTLLPLLVLVFWIGIYPNAFLSFMHASVTHLLDRVHGNASATADLAQNIVGLIK
jgi:NADH-quinone oxidoreductase subunit M